LSGGLLLALVILIIVFRRSGANSAPAGGTVYAGPSPALQAAQLQSGTQLQLAQIQSNAQVSALNEKLAESQLNTGAAVQVAQLQQQAQLQNIVTSGQVQSGQTSAALQSALAQVGGQVSIADINAQAGVAQSGIQADVMKTQFADALAAQQTISQAQTDQAKAALDTQATIAGYAADVNLAQIGASRDVALGNIGANESVQLGAQETQRYNTSVAGAVAINQQNNQAATEQTYLGDYTQLTQAQIDAAMQEHQANLNFAQSTLTEYNGSQNRLSAVETALGAPYTVPSIQSSEAAQNQPFGFGVSTPWGGFGVVNP